MTDRAAVEAWVDQWIRSHNIRTGYDALISDEAAEALVDLILAQRVEERDACERRLEFLRAENVTLTLELSRARGEGSG